MFSEEGLFSGVSVATIAAEEFQSSNTETFNRDIGCNVNQHRLTGRSRR